MCIGAVRIDTYMRVNHNNDVWCLLVIFFANRLALPVLDIRINFQNTRAFVINYQICSHLSRDLQQYFTLEPGELWMAQKKIYSQKWTTPPSIPPKIGQHPTLPSLHRLSCVHFDATVACMVISDTIAKACDAARLWLIYCYNVVCIATLVKRSNFRKSHLKPLTRKNVKLSTKF